MRDSVELMTRILDFNLAYAELLVRDLDESQMSRSGGPGVENHPAFTLGHLVMGAARTRTMLGGEMDVPAGWDAMFDREGPADRRLPYVGQYPTREELIGELGRQTKLLKSALESATEAQLADGVVWRYSDRLPSTRDAAGFMTMTHAAIHLGQMAAWRRAMGLKAALAEPD
jgi:hypothetical protein